VGIVAEFSGFRNLQKQIPKISESFAQAGAQNNFMKTALPRVLLVALICWPAVASSDSKMKPHSLTDFGAVGDDQTLDSAALQKAIDECAPGGTVIVPKGRFLVAGIRLKSDVRLLLEKDAILQGSTNVTDYAAKPSWNDAILRGDKVENIRIEGEGTIDGADCKNPKGEEGFRGPHAIFLTGCKNITISGVTITRAGNYAILCRDSESGDFKNIKIRGGHDGLHAQACRKFTVKNCDFRTGDDCLAGCDNEEFVVEDCLINSSCNGFRLGCDRLVVKRCRFWGPGEYQHQISKRTNMLAAFVHFAPTGRKPRLPSDNWLIEDLAIENADAVYEYDFEKGLWQTGQPAKKLHFRNIKATNLAKPLRVRGDKNGLFNFTLENSSLSLRAEKAAQEVVSISQFGAFTLRGVTLQNDGIKPVFKARDGGSVKLENVVPTQAAAFDITNVKEALR
jgi:hypothetical protein